MDAIFFLTFGAVFGFGFGILVPKAQAWVARRAEANKLKYAQQLVDAEAAAQKALSDAKALLRAQLPPLPSNPQPAPLPAGNVPTV